MTFRELIDYINEAINPHIIFAICISLVASRKYFIVALIVLVVSLLLATVGVLHNEIDTVVLGGIFTAISIGLVVWTRRLPKDEDEDEV